MKGDFYDLLAEVFTGKWREFANCIDAPLEFFMDENYYEKAETYCRNCSVSIECLDNAIYFDDGGYRAMSPKDRNSIVMHRRRHAQAFNYDINGYES